MTNDEHKIYMGPSKPIEIKDSSIGFWRRLFVCEEHTGLEFFFTLHNFEIYLDFSNCEDDIYTYHQEKRITVDPSSSVPEDYEEYLTTYEHVQVVFSKEGAEIDKETFAKELHVSINTLDMIVEMLIKKAEPTYFQERNS